MRKFLVLFFSVFLCFTGFCQADHYTFTQKIITDEYGETQTIKRPIVIYVTDTLITIKEKNLDNQYFKPSMFQNYGTKDEPININDTDVFMYERAGLIICLDKNKELLWKNKKEKTGLYVYPAAIRTIVTEYTHSYVTRAFIIWKHDEDGNIIETISYQ